MRPVNRLGNLASRAPMPVIGVDRDGRVIYVNDSICALTGYDRDELLGEFFWEFIADNHAEYRRRRFLDLRDDGMDSRFDAFIRTQNGRRLLISWHNVTFFDPDGRLESVFSIGADITALRSAEQRLERLNAGMRALGDISGIALRTDDPRELLERACESLIGSGVCTGAWIALPGDTGRPIGLVGASVDSAAAHELSPAALRELPDCVTRILDGPRQIAINEISDVCAGCQFAPEHDQVHGVATTIRHGDQPLAVLVAHVAGTSPVSEELKRVFSGIADDLGFALVMLEARAMHERTERSLADRTRMLNAFFETSLDPAAIFDRDFNFLRVNEAYAEACRMRPEELVGRNHFDLFPNDENQKIFQEVRDTGEPYTVHARPFEYESQPERGVTWWDWSLVPIRNDEGEVELLSLWLRDVTDEQLTKRQLQAQRDFTDAVVERAGSLVVVVDERGRIVRFNRACEELTGFSEADLLGRDLIEQLVPREDRERTRRDLSAQFKDDTAQYEYWWETAVGERRLISWQLAEVPAQSDSTDGPYTVATGWDVTEERRIARELRESEEKYRELVENAHTIIIRWDLDGTIRFVNEYGLDFFGYREDEMIGEHLGLIIPETDSYDTDLAGLVEQIAANPEDYSTNENENVARDGTRYWVSWSNRAIRDETGEITGIMAIGVDRTAERRAEQQLRDSRQNLRDLTAELAMAEQRERREIATVLHDNIGQLLAFAKMKLGAMREQADGDTSDLDDVLRYVDETIAETRALTSQLSPPVLDELGLTAALEWLTDELDGRHDVSIRLEISADPDELGEELALTLFQATNELITNAIKHADAGQVIVRLEAKDNVVCVEVADDGRGFDLHAVRSSAGRESGFGLFNVQERIMYLGGQVEIDSRPNDGARIKMICPTAAKEQGAP